MQTKSHLRIGQKLTIIRGDSWKSERNRQDGVSTWLIELTSEEYLQLSFSYCLLKHVTQCFGFVSVLYLLYFCHVVLFGVLFIIFVCQLQAHVGFTHVFCDSTCLPGRLVTFCGGAIQKKVLRFLPSWSSSRLSACPMHRHWLDSGLVLSSWPQSNLMFFSICWCFNNFGHWILTFVLWIQEHPLYMLHMPKPVSRFMFEVLTWRQCLTSPSIEEAC